MVQECDSGRKKSTLQMPVSTSHPIKLSIPAHPSSPPGLHHAISFLLPIQAANPWITHADLWTLAGVTAIEAMHGPKVPWRPGRTDYTDESHADDHRGNVGDRLPDGALGASHLREVFGRMGYSDKVSHGASIRKELGAECGSIGNRGAVRSA